MSSFLAEPKKLCQPSAHGNLWEMPFEGGMLFLHFYGNGIFPEFGKKSQGRLYCRVSKRQGRGLFFFLFSFFNYFYFQHQRSFVGQIKIKANM